MLDLPDPSGARRQRWRPHGYDPPRGRPRSGRLEVQGFESSSVSEEIVSLQPLCGLVEGDVEQGRRRPARRVEPKISVQPYSLAKTPYAQPPAMKAVAGRPAMIRNQPTGRKGVFRAVLREGPSSDAAFSADLDVVESYRRLAASLVVKFRSSWCTTSLAVVARRRRLPRASAGSGSASASSPRRGGRSSRRAPRCWYVRKYFAVSLWTRRASSSSRTVGKYRSSSSPSFHRGTLPPSGASSRLTVLVVVPDTRPDVDYAERPFRFGRGLPASTPLYV